MDAPPPALVDAYLQAIATKAPGTRDAYRRILRDLGTWLAAKPGCTIAPMKISSIAPAA